MYNQLCASQTFEEMTNDAEAPASVDRRFVLGVGKPTKWLLKTGWSAQLCYVICLLAYKPQISSYIYIYIYICVYMYIELSHYLKP